MAGSPTEATAYSAFRRKKKQNLGLWFSFVINTWYKINIYAISIIDGRVLPQIYQLNTLTKVIPFGRKAVSSLNSYLTMKKLGA